jgi:hypothetical protein
MTHDQTAEQVIDVLSRAGARGSAGRRGLGGGILQVSSHNGTHVDAPYHYHSTMNRGRTRDHHRRGAAGLVLRTRA